MRIVPDNFRADPYGWATNQAGHIGLGVVASIVACAVVLALFDQFPYRIAVWSMIVLIYVGLIELHMQGWRGGDTVEDAIFVCGYGAGSVLYAAHEVRPGTGDFLMNIWDIVPFVAFAAFHMLLGVGLRIRQKARETEF